MNAAEVNLPRLTIYVRSGRFEVCGSVMPTDSVVQGAKDPAAALSYFSSRCVLNVAVAATYTAEPIQPFLEFWLRELDFDGHVDFAPYNQVLQQLLDPGSLLNRNAGGVNLLLFRCEDWARFKPNGWDESAIRDGVETLAEALSAFAERSDVPTIVVAAPSSPRVSGDAVRAQLVAELEQRLQSRVLPWNSLHWLAAEELPCDVVERSYDEVGDHVGHMPFAPSSRPPCPRPLPAGCTRSRLRRTRSSHWIAIIRSGKASSAKMVHTASRASAGNEGAPRIHRRAASGRHAGLPGQQERRSRRARSLGSATDFPLPRAIISSPGGSVGSPSPGRWRNWRRN